MPNLALDLAGGGGGSGAGALLQMEQTDLVGTFTTTDTTSPGAQVVTHSVETLANSITRIDAIYTGSAANQNNLRLQIAIDSVVVAESGATNAAGFSITRALSYSAVLAAGVHTIELLAYLGAAGTLTIDATTAGQKATLITSEFAAP